MSHADFQDRLQRISASSPQQQSTVQSVPNTAQSRIQKLNHGLFAAGATIIAIGFQAVKYANEHYEAIRDESGLGIAIGIGLASIAVVVIGGIVAVRALPKKRGEFTTADASQYSANLAKPVRKASTGARVFCSLLGFAFGVSACFYMFAAAAARFVDTVAAQHLAIGSQLIALFLAFVSLLFGLVSLFIRGYSLGRVPVYFLFGVLLTFATIRIARINFLEWPEFMAVLQ